MARYISLAIALAVLIGATAATLTAGAGGVYIQ